MATGCSGSAFHSAGAQLAARAARRLSRCRTNIGLALGHATGTRIGSQAKTRQARQVPRSKVIVALLMGCVSALGFHVVDRHPRERLGPVLSFC